MLRYFDYIFTGVFTFEMLIKVKKKCVCLCVYLCLRLVCIRTIKN